MSVHISELVGYLNNPLGTFIELKSNDPVTPNQHNLNEYLDDFGVLDIYNALFDIYYVEDTPVAPVNVFTFCLDLIISDLDYMDRLDQIGELYLQIVSHDSSSQPGSFDEDALRMSDFLLMFAHFYIDMIYNDTPNLDLADIVLSYPQHIKDRLQIPTDNEFGYYEFNIIYDFVITIERYVVMAIMPFKRQNNALDLIQSEIIA